MNENKYFLPYQKRWLEDKSKVKIWEKSRRIGATYVQSYEDVRDCVAKNVPAVWFSSADESAAKEYILYCEQWAKIFNASAKAFDEELLDEDKSIKTFGIEFANGTRITALSSNPKAFRSKGGKVILDEFAWHKDQQALWTAAKPCITWGFPLRIISTHNGQGCKYFKFIEDVKKGKLKWSHHCTPIQLAVEEGLVDKICGHKTTKEEQDAWIEEEHNGCADEITWRQEYCCEAVDEAGSFLTYDLIQTCEKDNLLMPLEQTTGDLYLGMDIARKKHLSVIWVLEKLGSVYYTRVVKELEKMKFKIQYEILCEYLKHPNMRRACIDATGLGMQLAETAQDDFGKYKVEGITFTNSIKEVLAYKVLTTCEDRTGYIPNNVKIREDFHSLRKVPTDAGNIRFDVNAAETDGHADRFWAYSLALHAGGDYKGPVKVLSKGRLKIRKATDNF